MNFVEKLAAEGHLTAEQVERIGRNVRDFMEALDRDPSLKKEAMEKIAWTSAVRNLKPESSFWQHAYAHGHDVLPYLLASAGIGAGLGLGTDVARKAVRSVQDSYQKSRAYKTMIEENPNLSDSDPNMTEKAFNTLYRFNPEYAKDPLVAGTFVKNVLDQERLDIGTVSNLVQARRHMAESKGRDGGATEFFMKAMPKGNVAMELESERDEAASSAKRMADKDARSAAKYQEEMREQNVRFNEAQRRMDAAEEAFQAEQAKRQFWESAEPKYPDDPRVKP